MHKEIVKNEDFNIEQILEKYKEKDEKTLVFIRKVLLKYGDKFDLSKVVYIKNTTEVIIICPIHGEFKITPMILLDKRTKFGCKLCRYEQQSKSQSKDLDILMIELNNKYKGKLIFNKKDIEPYYKNNSSIIPSYCIKHKRVFRKRVRLFLSKNVGCKECNTENKRNSQVRDLEDVIDKAKKIHKGKYLYDIDLIRKYYINNESEIPIFCIECNKIFWQKVINHLQEKGCRECADRRTSERQIKDLDSVIANFNSIHKGLYLYYKEKIEPLYKGSNSEIPIFCTKCNRFFPQLVGNHLQGKGCPHCKQSYGNLAIYEWLEKHFIEFLKEYTFEDCKDKRKLPFDVYIPSLKIAIEYDGQQHFKPTKFSEKLTEEQIIKNLENQKRRDKIKDDYCKNNGIVLIRIPYNNFTRKKDVTKNVNNFLDNYFGI